MEPWTDELPWLCSKDSGQRQMLHKNSDSDTSNRQEQEKKLGTKTKLKSSGYYLYDNRDHNIKSKTMSSTGKKVIRKAKYDYMYVI